MHNAVMIKFINFQKNKTLNVISQEKQVMQSKVLASWL